MIFDRRQTTNQRLTRVKDSLLLKEDDEAVVAYYEHLAELASNKTDDAQGAWTSLHMGVAEKRSQFLEKTCDMMRHNTT